MIVSAGCDCAPTDAAVKRFAELREQTNKAIASWEDLQRTDVAAFQRLAIERGIPPVAIPAAGSAVSSGRNDP